MAKYTIVLINFGKKSQGRIQTYLLNRLNKGLGFFCMTCSSCVIPEPMYDNTGDDDRVTSEKAALPLSSVSKVTMALESEVTVKSKMSSLETENSVLMLDTLHTEMSSLRFRAPMPSPVVVGILRPGLKRRIES